MPMLTLAETLEISAAERELLVEADDAIRDIAAAVEECARRAGQDAPLVSRALAGIIVAAAARQTLIAYPSTAERELDQDFAALAAEAFEWASRRGAEPGRRGRACAAPDA
jgi:hypothetical protein